MIKFDVRGQKLEVSKIVVASSTHNYITAKAKFSDDWDDVNKFAHFKKSNNENYIIPFFDDVILGDSGVDISSGTWEVWISGTADSPATKSLAELTWTSETCTTGSNKYWKANLTASGISATETYAIDTLSNVKAGTTANTMCLSDNVLYIYNASSVTSPTGTLDYTYVSKRITTQRQYINVYLADNAEDFPEFTPSQAEIITRLAQYAYDNTITQADGTVDNQYGTPAVTVTVSGSAGSKKLTFAFSNIKGNGISSVTFSNEGVITITESSGNATTYSGVQEAISAMSALETSVEAAETLRVSAENTRISNETAREANKIAGATATVDSNVGTPSVTVSMTDHTGGGKDINFEFKNLKGTPRELSDLGVTATAAELNTLDGITATTTELNYVDGVTSSIQAQLNSKGTYTKPAGGIPKTDLASAVQTSLNKADSALQSVPATYRTSAAQDVIDATKVPTTRKVNGHALSADVNIDSSEIPHNETTVRAALTSAFTQITNINAKIPTEATSSNQLADKSYVGTQISAHHDSTKQDVISDLATIRSNASSGASKISCTDATVGSYGYTKNTGTITGINMNGASKGTSGVVDLGTVITSHQDISGKENASNKVTSISSASTDTEYPSAKCVYDLVGNIESALAALR